MGNKKVDEEFKGIKDYYFLQCKCTELKKNNQELIKLCLESMLKYSEKILENIILKDENERLKRRYKND